MAGRSPACTLRHSAGGAATPELPPELLAACDIAASGGEPEGGPRSTWAAGYCRRRGRGHWRRLVWRAGAWRPFAERALARRADRPGDIVPGIVWPGELVVHQRRATTTAPVTAVYVVCGAPNPHALWLCDVEERPGALRITLPDGRRIDRPDPRGQR
jgi:hypothetical protein